MWALAAVGFKPNPKSETRDLKSETRIPNPETRNPKPKTRNMKQVMWALATVSLTPQADLKAYPYCCPFSDHVFVEEVMKSFPVKVMEHFPEAFSCFNRSCGFSRRRASSLTRNPKPETRNPKPETINKKPETRNPKQVMWSLARPVLATVGLTPKAEL